MTNVLSKGVIVKRSGLIKGVSKLRMSVLTTKGVGNYAGVARNVKCPAAQNRKVRRRTITRADRTE